jgi:lipoprotein-anchoring transpeptidase ErfK/SrfK
MTHAMTVRERSAARGRCLALFVSAFLAVPAAAQAQAPSAAPAQQPAATQGGDVILSNLKTETRIAFPQSKQKVRKAPRKGSRSFARLHFYTEDGLPEVYVALRSRKDAAGRTWIQIMVPGRPNGRKGWVPRRALGRFSIVRYALRINRRTLRATLFKNGRKVFSARVGVGKASTKTPRGMFYVREKFRVRGQPVYGPYAIGTSAYAPGLTDWPGGGVIGIHGTNQPGLVPGRPSHGCIRMRNGDISRLYRVIRRGTPIEIV